MRFAHCRAIASRDDRTVRPSSWLRMLACAAIGLAAPFAAHGDEQDDIVIGQIVSRAGGVADVGREIGLGTQACVQWVNAGGGVRGRRLRLVSRDAGDDAAAALAEWREMVSRSAIVALLTPMGRAVNGDLLPWAAREGLAVLAPYGAGALSSQAAVLSSTFFLRTHPSVEALRITTQLQTLGIERIAVLYGDDDLGRETLAAFEEALASSGGAAAALIPLRGANAAQALDVLAKKNVQAVLLATVGEQTQAVLRGLEPLARAGRKVAPYALSTASSQAALRALGPAAQWLVVSQVLPPLKATGVPVVRTYLEALRGTGVREPSYPSFEGCVAVLTLAQALRSSTEPPTRAGVLKALRYGGLVDLGGWSVDLADRQLPGSRYTDITIIGPDGRWMH